MTSVGIVGASGYTGAELLRLCSQHPQLDVRVATADSQAGARVAEVYPSLAAAFPTLTLAKFDPESCDGLDLVFLAMPHGASQDAVPDLAGRVGRIVDLAADFRLEDPGSYRTWYGAEHARPGLLGSFAYGLPELF
jgi:N-acetyl-gamma-glutamyl-phosphate reductase